MGRGADLTGIAEPPGSYTSWDRERCVAEPAKRGQPELSRPRDAFARDRARVLHSSAFRRLAGKTQVVGPGENDFLRTRLTHSLEVAQIAREIGASLGCAPDVTDAAGLAHDLGHPPFGHNGEDALNDVAAPAGGFEGNAQTLRVLTRLEPKTVDPTGRSAGLNLTRAVLDAVTKYPWARNDETTKFGFYRDDLMAYSWLRGDLPDGRICLEAQVMDWSDDVAYSVHDVEDGVQAGHIRVEALDDDEVARAIAELAGVLYSPRPVVELEAVLSGLRRLPALRELRGFDGSHRALAAAKRATSELTGRFAGAAVSATRSRHPDRVLTRYAADLEVPADIAAECALLKAMAAHFVMQRPGSLERRLGQRVLLTELVEVLVDAGPAALEIPFRPAAIEAVDAGDDDARLRIIVDQVASLTDAGAVAWHGRWVGPRATPIV